MQFFHVSKDLILGEIEFIPRIPKYRCKDEDDTTKRICVCPSIKEAISAFPYKGEFVNCDMKFKKNNYLSVFNTESTNFLSDEAIHDKVPDSHITKEHWLLEPFKATANIIKIKKLILSGFNKYICEYHGDVQDLEYETAVMDSDRDEEFVFISKDNFNRFSKVVNRTDIEAEVLEDKTAKLTHSYNIPTTKKYRWIKVKIHVPAGVSILPLWLIDEKQNNLALKKHFAIKEWKVLDDFWWEMET